MATSTVTLSYASDSYTLSVAMSPQVVHVEAVSRIVPGDDGPPGANAEVVVLTLADYLALSPAAQMDGRWYVVPKS